VHMASEEASDPAEVHALEETHTGQESSVGLDLDVEAETSAAKAMSYFGEVQTVAVQGGGTYQHRLAGEVGYAALGEGADVLAHFRGAAEAATGQPVELYTENLALKVWTVVAHWEMERL